MRELGVAWGEMEGSEGGMLVPADMEKYHVRRQT
jgi:hypothetical protein